MTLNDIEELGYDDATVKFLCGAVSELKLACKSANFHGVKNNKTEYRHWDDRAQNLRRVLVDYGVLLKHNL